ncbi:MAG: radical SAM protein [Chitinivibrionales bacterium]|nr:radical SAM protein [Chitinivibrionales bacterium]
MIKAVLEITTTIGCDIRCAYCPQDTITRCYSEKNDGHRMMSFENFAAWLENVPAHVEIHFAGMAEPWLNPDCSRMVLHAHENGHGIVVSTTLCGMKPSDIDRIEHIPFLLFAVHVPDTNGWENINIDGKYIEVLDRFLRSNITQREFIAKGEPHALLKKLIGRKIKTTFLHSRAGNIEIDGRDLPERKKGVIRCLRDCRYNVLLPNGDVLLCCMDYGMKHILGNLNKSDYNTLFCDSEFLKIQQGLDDDRTEIICRYCEKYMATLLYYYFHKIKQFII